MVALAGDAGVKWRVVAAALLLTACATPAERIAARLERAGVPHPQAACMGDRLVKRLSLSQMVALDRVVQDRSGDRLTINRLIVRLGNADPALVAQLVETGLVCAI